MNKQNGEAPPPRADLTKKSKAEQLVFCMEKRSSGNFTLGEREATKPVLNRRRQLTNTNNSQGVQKTIKNIARMNMGTTVPRKAIVTEWHTKKGSWLCQKRARLNSWSVAGRIGVVVCQTANCNSDLENNCEK